MPGACRIDFGQPAAWASFFLRFGFRHFRQFLFRTYLTKQFSGLLPVLLQMHTCLAWLRPGKSAGKEDCVDSVFAGPAVLCGNMDVFFFAELRFLEDIVATSAGPDRGRDVRQQVRDPRRAATSPRGPPWRTRTFEACP